MPRFIFQFYAALVAAALAQPCIVAKGMAQGAHRPADKQRVTLQPDPSPDVIPFYRDWTKDTEAEPNLSREATIEHLRAAIKYVFVIFNENESFDHNFGTFPGANGIYSDGQHPRAPKDTPGFIQTYKDLASGETVRVVPFCIGPDQNANVFDSVDHRHIGLARKLHVSGNIAAMDQFALDEYSRFAAKGGAANEAQGTQFARLVMSHIDCDTIPFFWQYASRFVLFDNIFATEDTPSTPNAVAMIAGQAGETQWVKQGPNGRFFTVGNHSGTTQGLPLLTDGQPFYGSQYDRTKTDREPAGAKESYADNNIASNLTFASLPLTFQGRDVTASMSQDLNPGFDLPDIQKDVAFLAGRDKNPVAWRWYQEGYDHEPTDTSTAASHESYISHHEGPQYFGYIANNPALRNNLRGLGDFFTNMAAGGLPPDGGVFYIRGGFVNIAKQVPFVHKGTPAAEAKAIAAAKGGDDDHPGYSDHQISEAMDARVINAIASNPDIWNRSVIIIAYDESDGFYDHVPPRILSYGPDGLPLSRGIRVPLIVISPYARVHAVSHAEGDHNAVIETINAIFGLPALANLPDEAEALTAGRAPAFNGPNGFVQNYLGPRDINSPISDDLLSAFDPKRLLGLEPLLPGSYASIAEEVVNSLPHYGGHGCAALGITTEDRRQGVENLIPPGFNPLPATYPAAN
ncbi:MAG TPA: alkaline phosphatase family protein [Methylocella sp.]|nr:alkaline phosphatase family protein [Methylocella sp.]